MFNQGRDEDEFEPDRHSFGPRVGSMIAIVSGVILAILMIVFAVNNKNNRLREARSALREAQKETAVEDVDLSENYDYDRTGKDVEQLYRDGKLRAEDLDIWDMYNGGAQVAKIKEETPVSEEGQDPDILPPYEIPQTASPEPSGNPGDPRGEEGEDPLLKDVPLNNIDYTKIKVVNDKMSYESAEDGASKLGVEISQDSGAVDFDTLRNNGVDFVMLRVGFRGYDSGLCLIDNAIERNIRGATQAGLKIGLYFSSRAVSPEEAIEEAHCCMDVSKDYSITYPVAYLYEGSPNTASRTDALSMEDRTRIMDAFLSELRGYGYTPMICGTERFLLHEIIPDTVLKTYDIWLFDTGNMPSYPYRYKLWKYNTGVTIPGIENKASYLISFVDYSGR